MSDPCREEFREYWAKNSRTDCSSQVSEAIANHAWQAAWNARPVAEVPSAWIPVSRAEPELKDGGVLVHFDNGSIETVHIEYFFKPITAGIVDGGQTWTKRYLRHEPKVTHWQPLPAPPYLLAERNGGRS